VRFKSLFLAVAFAVACSETTSPIAENYMLIEIGGQSLPAPYAMNPQMSHRILSAGMQFNASGTGTWTWTFELEPNGAHQTLTQGISWTKNGNTIEVTFDCNDTASCIAGPHLVGDVSDGRIDVKTSNVMRAPMVFITGQD
jgi:hypothetical protein